MDQDPEQDAQIKPDVATTSEVPPPDLSRRPPPPPSPLDQLAKSTSPPRPLAEDAAARVNLRPARDAGESSDDASAAAGIASFNSRVVAGGIDVLVALGVAIGLGWLLPDFAAGLAKWAGIAYLIARDSLPFLGGQSIGKKAMRLQVTMSDGTPLQGNWPAALIRNGILLIPFFAFVEIFVLLNRDSSAERGRRLGDDWAKTRVIVEKPTAAEDRENEDP